MTNYPIIRFVARHGTVLACAIAGACLVATLLLANQSQSALMLAIGAGACAVLLGVMLTAAELVRVIADTLLPR